MSNGDPERNDEVLHYEHGLPVFNARLEKVERKQDAEETRYKDEQLNIDRNMMYFTGALVICSIISAVVSGYQAHVARLNASAAVDNASAAKAQAEATKAEVDEMKKSGTDTHDLAVQAKQQADSSQQQAVNTKSLAENAARTLHSTQAAFRDDQRAWLGIDAFRVTQFEQNKPIKVDIQIKNTGKTPALHIEEWMKYKFSTIAQVGPLATDFIPAFWQPQGSTPPQGDQAIHVTIPWELWKGASPIMSIKRTELSIFGEIGYDDASGRPHRTQVCLHMPDVDSHDLFFCDRWNDMN